MANPFSNLHFASALLFTVWSLNSSVLSATVNTEHCYFKSIFWISLPNRRKIRGIDSQLPLDEFLWKRMVRGCVNWLHQLKLQLDFNCQIYNSHICDDEKDFQCCGRFWVLHQLIIHVSFHLSLLLEYL